MMISQNVYREILAEYEVLSDEAKKTLAKKKEVCYKKCPRIKEIDDELNMTAIKISKAIILATKEQKENYIEQIKKITENLREEKEKLMSENGFSYDYFDDIFKCRKCKDTGFIKNKKCECFEQKLINRAYKVSKISEVMKTEDFSDFSLDYYSKEKFESYELSPYQNMKRILTKSSLFVEEFDENYKNMVFYGEPGLGKTFLCGCIAKDLLKKGKTVLYISAFELFELFEKEKFNKNNSDEAKLSNSEILEFTKSTDLLIIDDLGTEFITSLSTAELFEVINRRILNRKHTIISTNLSPDKLVQHYSSRIVSRLYGEYDMFMFYGEDIRLNKKIENIKSENINKV